MPAHNQFTIGALFALQRFLDRSSEDDTSPMGDFIGRGPYAQLVRIGMDDVLPDMAANLTQGSLPLLVVVEGDDTRYVPSQTVLVPVDGQPKLADRAAHIEWLSTAGRDNFPACYVLRIAEGQTMRQARAAAGIADDEERLIVGISTGAFDQVA